MITLHKLTDIDRIRNEKEYDLGLHSDFDIGIFIIRIIVDSFHRVSSISV